MNKIFLIILIVSSVFMASCATVPIETRMPDTTPVTPPPELPPEPITPIQPDISQFPASREDIYHVVGPGETLWRIGKMYDVKVDDIMQANNLGDARRLDKGQCILIPRAAPIKPVIPLYKSEKWKYIVIHHSATDVGDALRFNEGHLKRGFWQGLGYHFVIDNGSCGKTDGQIEISPRWIKQQDGAHCRASRMNYRGIGICLVGNFSQEKISEQQMSSLAYLVNLLRRNYDIPPKNILGHSGVPGASTECPGRYFPWQDFWTRLR